MSLSDINIITYMTSIGTTRGETLVENIIDPYISTGRGIGNTSVPSNLVNSTEYDSGTSNDHVTMSWPIALLALTSI